MKTIHDNNNTAATSSNLSGDGSKVNSECV